MPAYFKSAVFESFLRYLILIAQNKRVVPYNELENLFALSHNMTGFYAGHVGNFCKAHKWPPLNSLIINTTTCAPSEGFDSFLEDEGGNWGECLTRCWKEFHLPTSRELQVKNFSGLSATIREWEESLMAA